MECVQSKGLNTTRQAFPACKPYINVPGSDECTQGPAFWCSSEKAFEKCVQSKGFTGQRADFAACKPYIPVIIGDNKCTQGPAYYCASQANFNKCNTNPNSTFQNVCGTKPGQNKCSMGPTYWCSSKKNYNECVKSGKSFEDFCYNNQPDDNLHDINININAVVFCQHCGQKVKN
jgi:hypothetical protein